MFFRIPVLKSAFEGALVRVAAAGSNFKVPCRFAASFRTGLFRTFRTLPQCSRHPYIRSQSLGPEPRAEPAGAATSLTPLPPKTLQRNARCRRASVLGCLLGRARRAPRRRRPISCGPRGGRRDSSVGAPRTFTFNPIPRPPRWRCFRRRPGQVDATAGCRAGPSCSSATLPSSPSLSSSSWP